MEGVSDIVTAIIDGIVFRNFNWKSWAIGKGVSYTISIACAGATSLMSTFKAFRAGMSTVKIGKAVVGDTARHVLFHAIKRGAFEVAKQTGVSFLGRYISDFVFKQLAPFIKDGILKLISASLRAFLKCNEHFKKLIRIDTLEKSTNYMSLIRNKVMEIIEQKSFLRKAIEVAEDVIAGIAKNMSNKHCGAILSFLINQITRLFQTSEKIGICIKNFKESFVKTVENICNDDKVKNADVDAKKVEKNGKSENDSKIETIKDELSKSNKNETFVEDSKIEENETELEADRIKEFEINFEVNADKAMEQINNLVADKLSVLINNGLIAPNIQSAVSSATNKITSGIENKINSELETILADRRIKVNNDGDPYNLLPEDYKNISKHPEAIKTANKIIDDAENGGELGLAHLGEIQKKVDRQIEVLDSNGKHMHYIGKAKEGEEPVRAQYHEAKNGKSAHWTLPNGVEAPIVSSNPNDCLINVIACQTKINARTMRGDIVKGMRNNFNSVANTAFDYMRLEKYMKPALVLGGAIFDARNPEDTKRFLKAMIRVHPIGTSHPDIHIGIENSKDTGKSCFFDMTQASNALYEICSKHLDEIDNMNANMNNGVFRNLVLTVNADGILKEYPMFVGGQFKIAKSFVVVLRHEYGHHLDPKRPVVVHTFYPRDYSMKPNEKKISFENFGERRNRNHL
jgi:hypothetical protein